MLDEIWIFVFSFINLYHQNDILYGKNRKNFIEKGEH